MEVGVIMCIHQPMAYPKDGVGVRTMGGAAEGNTASFNSLYQKGWTDPSNTVVSNAATTGNNTNTRRGPKP